VVLVSGIIDFLMGIILWKFQNLNKKARTEAEKEAKEKVEIEQSGKEKKEIPKRKTLKVRTKKTGFKKKE